MLDLVDIAANEFESKVEIATCEHMADDAVNRNSFVTDEEPYRILETSLILPFHLSLEATASTNTAESILKHSSDINRKANQACMRTHIPTCRQSDAISSCLFYIGMRWDEV